MKPCMSNNLVIKDCYWATESLYYFKQTYFVAVVVNNGGFWREQKFLEKTRNRKIVLKSIFCGHTRSQTQTDRFTYIHIHKSTRTHVHMLTNLLTHTLTSIHTKALTKCVCIKTFMGAYSDSKRPNIWNNFFLCNTRSKVFSLPRVESYETYQYPFWIETRLGIEWRPWNKILRFLNLIDRKKNSPAKSDSRKSNNFWPYLYGPHKNCHELSR